MNEWIQIKILNKFHTKDTSICPFIYNVRLEPNNPCLRGPQTPAVTVMGIIVSRFITSYVLLLYFHKKISPVAFVCVLKISKNDH
jgi:hypothetical protein